jgi:hypothetical protein
MQSNGTTIASLLALLLALAPYGGRVAAQEAADYEFHDSHFHLTNYVQEGTDIRDFVAMMGSTIGRSTVFGIPLQQQWSYQNTGDFAPTYYLHSDAPLYYYSFTDGRGHRDGVPLAERGGAGAARPHDHRLQSGRRVRRRSHPPRARDLPRGVLGDRRIHDPQGVRIATRRSTAFSISPAKWDWW